MDCLGAGMPQTEPPAPELPALVLQVVGSCLPPRAAAQCRLVCRQWRSAFAGSIDCLYLQVHLDAEVTDRHIAAAAAAFPAATRATLLLPNCSYARCNPYDSCGGVSAARTALGRRSNAANEARRRALLPGAAAAGAAGAGGGAGAALAAAAGQELGEAGEQGRVNGQEAGEADAASASGQSDSPEEGDGDTGADGGQCATSDAHANAGASPGSASDPALPAAHTAQVLPPAPPLPPPLSPLEVGRLACEAALGSVRRHLPGLVGLRVGHAQRPPPRLGPLAALAQSLRHPELAAAAASATASTSTGEPGAAASPSGQQPQQPQQLQCYPGYRLDSAAHATPAALAASHWSYPASLVPAEGAAAWPQPQHTVSQHAAEQAVAAAHRSALDLTPLLLPSAQQDEAAAAVAVAAAAAGAGDGAADGAEGREEAAVAGNAVKGGKAPPPSWATSAPLPRLTSLAELDLRCAAAVGALAPLSSLGSSSGGELTCGYGSSNHAAHGSNNGNLAPDSRQQQQEQQQQQQLPLPALTALTVLQLREGGQLPAIRALGGRLRALDLWCNEGSSLADLAYWTSAAPQRIRRGLPLLASGLTRLTRLVLRELAAQVEPPAALTCLCSLPLLSSLTAEVLYVDPWRQLAELAEQLAGDEEEAEEEEESEGEEEEEQSEEGSESGSESEEESDGGEVVEESEELGSSEEGLVAPVAAARAREGSAVRLPPAARAREMEFSFSRGPQLGLSGLSAGAGDGVNGADFAAAIAATQAVSMPSPTDAAAAAAVGSAASPSVAAGSAGPAPAVAPASAATAAIAAAAAAASELAALAVALGPGRVEHIRAVLERGSGALQEMAPMDLFSCFAGGSSNDSGTGSSSAAAGAAGGSGSSRVGLTELDVTFVGCGLLPGCWAGVEALGGSLRRLALRVGRSAEEERLVARLLQRLAPAASSSSTVSSGWLPGAFRVTSLSALPHLTHLDLDTPLCPRLAARLLRLAPPPQPPEALSQPPVQPPPESTLKLQQPTLQLRLESLQLYGVHDVEVEASPQPQPLQTAERKSAGHDARTELTTPLPLAPAASATAMMRKLHLDGDLSAVAAALAGGALVGVTGHEGCSSPAGLLLPRLAELRLAHRPAGRPAAATVWLLLPWRALPPSLEQLHLEGLDMRLQPLTASSYVSSSSSGGNRGGEAGHQRQLLLPRLQRLQLRHCAAELGQLRACPLEELAVAAAWLLLPGSNGAENSGAAPVAAVAVAPAVAAAPWDVAAQLAAVRSQPWTPRLRSLSLQLCAAPRGATRLSPGSCDAQTPATAAAAPACGGAGAAAVAAAATPGATAAMPGLERLSVTWELAALVDPDALQYGNSGSRWAAPPADPDLYGGGFATPSPVGLTPRAARALLEGLLPPGAVSAVGGGGGGGAACASASPSSGGAAGSGSGRSAAPAGATPVLRSLELYVGDVGGGADDGNGSSGGSSEGGLSVEELLWLARLRSLRRLRLVLCVSESGGDTGAATGTSKSLHACEAAAATAAGAAGGPDVAALPPACAPAGVRAAAPAAAGPTSAWLHAELGELLLAALPYCQTQVVQVRVP